MNTHEFVWRQARAAPLRGFASPNAYLARRARNTFGLKEFGKVNTLGRAKSESILEERYKLAEYYAVNGKVESQWEMDDLLSDPLEVTNIAWPTYNRSPEQQKEYDRLRLKLEYVKSTRLQPLPDEPRRVRLSATGGISKKCSDGLLYVAHHRSA
jgi:hypothetical protein